MHACKSNRRAEESWTKNCRDEEERSREGNARKNKRLKVEREKCPRGPNEDPGNDDCRCAPAIGPPGEAGRPQAGVTDGCEDQWGERFARKRAERTVKSQKFPGEPRTGCTPGCVVRQCLIHHSPFVTHPVQPFPEFIACHFFTFARSSRNHRPSRSLPRWSAVATEPGGIFSTAAISA